MAPVGDCREAGSRRCGSAVAARMTRTCPPIEYHRLTRRQIAKAFDRHAAVRRAEILAIGKVMRVGAKLIEIRRITFDNFDLRQHRIGLKINAHRHAQMLGAQYCGCGEIDKDIGLVKEPLNLRLGKTEGAIAHYIAIGPAVRKTVRRHDLAKEADRIAGIRRNRIFFGIVRPCSGILDIINVEA